MSINNNTKYIQNNIKIYIFKIKSNFIRIFITYFLILVLIAF